MKLEESKIIQLLGIINLYPSVGIMHISDGSHLLTKKIVEFCQEHDYGYLLHCTNDILFEKSVSKYEGNGVIKIKRFHIERLRYNFQPKICDYLFITSRVAESNLDNFVHQLYPTIKNGGLIIVFVAKGDLKESHLWSQSLQENNFVATNRLDDVFENYDLIISKKMHGWGG